MASMARAFRYWHKVPVGVMEKDPIEKGKECF